MNFLNNNYCCLVIFELMFYESSKIFFCNLDSSDFLVNINTF